MDLPIVPLRPRTTITFVPIQLLQCSIAPLLGYAWLYLTTPSQDEGTQPTSNIRVAGTYNDILPLTCKHNKEHTFNNKRPTTNLDPDKYFQNG